VDERAMLMKGNHPGWFSPEAAQLNMGSPFRLSRPVSLCRAHPQAFQPYVKAMTKCKV
jgi:hypothetical protein